MINNVYTIYNKKSCRYGDVMAFPTDDFAIARIKEFNGIKEDEHELCRIGTIDIESGVLSTINPIRIPFNLELNV